MGRGREGNQRHTVPGTIKLLSTDQEGPFNLALFRVICVELGEDHILPRVILEIILDPCCYSIQH